MPTGKTASKKTAAEIKRAIEAIEAEIQKEKKKREKSGETFVSLTREQLENKLKRAESPVITWQSWNNTAPIGGTINYTVGVTNPDPFAWVNLAVAVAVGNRNPITSNDLFLSDFDRRFPTLAQPATIGFSLGPAGSGTASTSFSFALRIPSGVEKTGYFGNSVLQQLNFHDVGKYLDRGVFFFGVV
ncbi:MAG: OmpH family outer membrane protein [Acidobacteriota bacterium]